MFAIHDVFEPTSPLPRIKGRIRVIDVVALKAVVVVHVDDNSVPFRIDYEDWTRYLTTLQKTDDPDQYVSVNAKRLPVAAAKRYELVLKATQTLSCNPTLLHRRNAFAVEIAAVAKSMGRNARTIKRWICQWLKSGRNPAAVVSKFLKIDSTQLERRQSEGLKRGVVNRVPEIASHVPAYTSYAKIKKAWDAYVVGRNMTWPDAYHEMLTDLYKVPEKSIERLLLDPILIEKHLIPKWDQVRYRFRQFKRAAAPHDPERPQGSRGTAAGDVFGPGFFEIDATKFQIQLVSRLTKGKLVGSPTVYLIVDVYCGVIVGYAVTLENPSWAAAALALWNCFSDKGAVFKRLGLPYDSTDWPCHQLPNMLRADRAELVSNMGQKFPSCGIRVEITPAMNPEAKGTVEGKNFELKKPRPGRFNLPGRFSKKRERRSPDGKRDAALDIFEFERILVEIIMDINREPINPKRIPPDALPFGAKIASRIGFYEWALEHRAGFTREMGPNFAYEYLLHQAKGTMSSLGIRVEGELFDCDRLRELGYVEVAVNADDDMKIPVAYNPHLASEIYFFDRERGIWTPAYNIEPEIYHIKASFAEAKNYRSLQKGFVGQARLNAHVKRRARQPEIQEDINRAVREKQDTPTKTSRSKANIRENRVRERANERSPGMNGALAVPAAPSASAGDSNAALDRSVKKSGLTNQIDDLWSEVNAISKQ